MRAVQKVWRVKEIVFLFCRVSHKTLSKCAILPSASIATLGKGSTLPSAINGFSAKTNGRDGHLTGHVACTCGCLPSALCLALGKEYVCRVLIVCQVYCFEHSVKIGFAECPTFGPQQTRHSAYWRFPVVVFGRAFALAS